MLWFLEWYFDRSLEPHRRFPPACNMRNFTYYAPDESATDAYSAEHLIRTMFAQTHVADANLIRPYSLSIHQPDFKLSHYPFFH